jgi:gas vesicle protein
MNENKNQGSGFLSALLTGAAIGAGLALLFTTERGTRTRKKIWSKVKETSGDICAHCGEKKQPDPETLN